LENTANVNTSMTKRIGSVWAVAHESTIRDELTPNVRHGHPVVSRKGNELGAPIIKKWVSGNQDRVDVLLINGCEGGLEVAFSAGIEYTNLAPERVHRRLKFCQLRFRDWVIHVCKYSDPGDRGNQFEQEFQSLCHGLACDQSHARDVTARPVEAVHDAEHDRI